MSGFFGCISKNDYVSDVFYGTDYHLHLGRFAVATVSRIVNLATHTAVRQLEGKDEFDMKEYSDIHNGKYITMVKQIRRNLNLTSLIFKKLGELVEAIGLPKEKLCTHCWDGSSYF